MKKLTKSRRNKKVEGVLGGIGEYLNIDPTILRILFVVSLFLGYGTPILLYIALALIVPSPPSHLDVFYNTKQRKDVTPDDQSGWSDF